jgi:hypothetical protein
VLLIPDLIIFNREARELDPEKFPSNIRWQYEHTMNTLLELAVYRSTSRIYILSCTGTSAMSIIFSPQKL